MSIRVTVDGQPLDPPRLWHPHMGLSSARPRVPPSTFRVVVPASDLLALLAAPYAACVEELKRDDALTGETDVFSDSGYPDLPELLRRPALCGWVMDTHFAGELFGHFLPWGNSGPGSYVIESIAHVAAEGDRVCVSGVCLRV